MKRRAFVAAAASAVMHRPVLVAVLELREPTSTPTPLPSRLGIADVRAIEDMTAKLGDLARTHGGYAPLLTPTAERAERLLRVPAAADVRRELGVAVAHLRSIAGWAGFDAAKDDRTRYHLSRSVEIAAHNGDPYRAAYSLYLAGVISDERGVSDDALEFYRLAESQADKVLDDESRTALTAWLRADTAGAYVNVERPREARQCLAEARRWTPSGDDAAELDFVSALVETGLGNYDVAESLAASAIRHRQTDRRAAVVERIAHVQLHVLTGDSQAPAMAESVIRDVTRLHSQRARDRLGGLADTLETRRHTDLARMAREVSRG